MGGISYTQGDQKWHRVRHGGVWMAYACCDCGLVHGNQYRIHNGQIWRRVWRDERRTAMIRRHMVRNGNAVRQPKANLYIIPLRITKRKPPAQSATIRIKRMRK